MAQFVGRHGGVDEQLGDTRLEVAQGLHPKLFHALLLLIKVVENQVVRKNDALGGKLFPQLAEPKPRRRALRRHPQREVELQSELQVNLNVARVVVQRTHVRVEVRHVDTGIERLADLSASLNQRLRRFAVNVHLRDAPPQVTLRIHQPRHLVAGSNRPPAVHLPLGGVAEMDAEVLLRVRLGIARDLGEPRARHHDRRRGHEAALERVYGGNVGGVAHAGVVAVYDEQFVRGLVAEALGESRAGGLGQGNGEKRKCQGSQSCSCE